MTDTKIKIGDVIYYRHERGGITFIEKEIVGETSRSWLLLDKSSYQWQRNQLARYATKLPKCLRDKDGAFFLGTKEQAELGRWAQQYSYQIGNRVQYTHDAEKMLATAKLYDFHPLPGEPEPKR